MPQRVAVTGSSGMIGGALSSALTERGDEVIRLVRREPEDSSQVRWDPARKQLDPQALQGVDVVVNLAGAGIGDHRWTDEYKQVLVDSRVDSTTLIARTLAEVAPDARLVSGSAIGFYGDRGDQVLTETSSGGAGFLADLVRRWEAAAAPAVAVGAPTAFARTGLVFSSEGGALAKMLPLGKLGLGGPLGSGRQWWSWISLQDEVRALIHLIDHPEVTGPVNLTGPAPERQWDVARALGRLLHRPALLPAPSFALRAVLGEFSGDILASQRVLPAVLADSGFVWDEPDVESALRWVLSD